MEQWVTAGAFATVIVAVAGFLWGLIEKRDNTTNLAWKARCDAMELALTRVAEARKTEIAHLQAQFFAFKDEKTAKLHALELEIKTVRGECANRECLDELEEKLNNKVDHAVDRLERTMHEILGDRRARGGP